MISAPTVHNLDEPRWWWLWEDYRKTEASRLGSHTREDLKHEGKQFVLYSA